MQYKLVFSFLFLGFLSFAQTSTQKVLFLGNSYTSVNNLPQMLKDVALSVNDSVIFDVNAPGGYTFQGHSTNATSLAKIMVGDWDYVVLQEQSQMPSFPDQQVLTDVFPYANQLDSLVNLYNPCAETVFYMTWGRKNGDASNCASWPPVCTYNGMDSLLNLRYQMMAQQNDAIVSPVGEVWNYVRVNHPEIELYQSDESHPSIAGTYLAACTFYATIFRKDPTLITYFSTLTSVDASKIQQAVKLKVFDSLINWNVGIFDPMANFDFSEQTSNLVSFTNNSTASDSLSWDFGDGSFSIESNPSHQYNQPGEYLVTLTIYSCGKTDSVAILVTTNSAFVITEKLDSFSIYPNPVSQFLNVESRSNEITNFKISNALGEILLDGSLSFGKNEILISHLESGIYQIEFNNNSNRMIKNRFVK
jgi:hypothetical protein